MAVEYSIFMICVKWQVFINHSKALHLLSHVSMTMNIIINVVVIVNIIIIIIINTNNTAFFFTNCPLFAFYSQRN